MADSKVSALPAAASLTGAELVPVVQGGNSVRSTVGAILALASAANVITYGADPSGTLDSTVAIQAALNSGAKAVFVPPGNFKYSALVMPTTFGFVFYGVGTASVLTQTGTGITWPSTGTSPCGYYEGYIRDLSFVAIGTANGHTINTQFAGGVTLMNLYFGNMPVGFDSIHVQGAPASTGDKYSHDVHIINLQIYSNTAGRAGIYYDQYASDTSFSDFKMNGNFVVPYCIFMANGAQSVNGSNSHPYNALTNIMFVQGGAATALGMTFTNVIFDNSSGGDNVVLNNCSAAVFTGCWWEVVNAGKNGLTLNNSRSTCVTGCRFDSGGGALFCVTETGTSDNTQVISGDCPTIGNFSNPPINFIGAHSVVKNFVAYNVFGQQMAYTGATVSTVAAGSTGFLGCNGFQAAEVNTGFMSPLVSGVNCLRADIAFSVAPGVGQTFTFTLRGNSAALVAAAGSVNPAVVTGAGVFTTSIIIAQGAGAFVGQFNQLSIQVVTSAGAAPSAFRYVISCIG